MECIMRISFRKYNFDKRQTIIETEIKILLMSFNLHIHSVVYFSSIYRCPMLFGLYQLYQFYWYLVSNILHLLFIMKCSTSQWNRTFLVLDVEAHLVFVNVMTPISFCLTVIKVISEFQNEYLFYFFLWDVRWYRLSSI